MKNWKESFEKENGRCHKAGRPLRCAVNAFPTGHEVQLRPPSTNAGGFYD